MPPAPLRIRLLGELELWRGDALLDFPPSKKTRALFAYLVATGRSHRRERLTALLWDVTDDPKAALRWSLSKLRTLVDEQDARRIIADRDAVAFEAKGADIDVLEVARALAIPMTDIPTSDLEGLARRFRGTFLEGLDLTDFSDFHAWCIAERDTWRSRHETILRTLVDRHTSAPETALSFARPLVALCPTSESARATLARLLHATGRRQEAEEHYTLGLRELERARVAATGELASTWRSIKAPAVSSAETNVRPEGPKQTVRFCRAKDGARIAYATVGQGPLIIKASNWLTHLEYDWKSPIWRHLARDLSQHYELVRYDQRGNGLSDWDCEMSFDAFVDDLEAVVEARGAERFTLLGISQGTRVAIAYAVRHPERVSHLVLYGGSPRGWRRRPPEVVERREALATLLRTGWATDTPAFRQIFSNLFMPEATPEQIAWFNELQAVSCSPENAVRLDQANADSDVMALLEKVTTPTLVMHATEDAMVGFDESRTFAAEIPGARFVALESKNHLLLGDEPAWRRFVAEIRDFLATE